MYAGCFFFFFFLCQYVGPTFKFSLGNQQFLHINDPEVVKELSLCTSLGFGKPSFPKKLFDPLLGEGIVNANGAVWSQQRKIIAPEFFNEKVKVCMSYTYIVRLSGSYHV